MHLRKPARMGAANKTFVSNLLMLIGINLLIKPIYVLIIEAQVQERVGAENFGVYFALLNLTFILNILTDLGITNWNNRQVAERGIIVRKEVLKLIRIRLLLGIGYLAVCFIIAFLLSYRIDGMHILLVLAVNQVLATGILFFRSYLSGLHLFAADRIISISDRILLILLLGCALLFINPSNPFPLDFLIYGQTIAYSLTLFLAIYFVMRRSEPETSNDYVPSTTVLNSSLPFAALILVSMTSNRIDAVMLERLSDSYQAGIYAMTFRLSDTLTMIAYLFAVLLLPIFTRMLSQQKSPIELFGVAFRMLLAGCAWVVGICILSPEWVLDLIYDGHLTEASSVLPWTMAGAALFSLQYSTGTLLTAGAHMKQLIAISFIALVINIVLNFLLIPQQMAVGVAKTAFITQAIVFTSQAIIAHLKYRIWTKSILLHSILFVALACCTIILMKSIQLDSAMAVLIGSIMILITAILLRMIPIREMMNTLHNDPIEKTT